MSKPDPFSLTLRFKKSKLTIFLMLAPEVTLDSAKAALLNALKSRGLSNINGDTVPENSTDIELGVAVDKNNLEKGWTSLEAEAPPRAQNGANDQQELITSDGDSLNLQAAGVRNGQAIAFRFRAARDQGELEEDPGWDVVAPSLEEEEDEEI